MNRLETLLHRWEDGSIPAAELAELKGLLKESGNREALVEHLRDSNTIHSVIQAQASDRDFGLASLEQEAPIPFPGEKVSSQRLRRSGRRAGRRRDRAGGKTSPLPWFLAAAAVLAIVVGVRFMGGSSVIPIDQGGGLPGEPGAGGCLHPDSGRPEPVAERHVGRRR